jgi:hypothetical protein
VRVIKGFKEEKYMRKAALGAVVFVAAAISLGGGQKAHAQNTETTKPPKKVVVVESGDSLSKIAQKHKTTYQRLYYANKNIKHPDLIYPAQKLRVPTKSEKLKARAMPADAQVPVQPVAQKHTVAQPASTWKSAPVAPVASAGGGVWDRLAACESGGNWAINTGNGYYGGLQFSLSSWRGVGGQGYPHQASKAEQIARAEMLRASGGWGHWPACSAKLGLR